MNTPMLSRTLTRTLLVALTLAVVPFALTACGDNAADGPPNVETDEVPMDAQMGNGMMEDGMMDGGGGGDPAMRDEAALPRMENGIQVVEVTVGPGGYTPQDIRLQTGTPARLVFTRTTEQTCATQIEVPAFDVGPVDLPLNEPVAVEFTPEDAGDFTFTCGMDMVSGSLVTQS